MSMHHKAFRFDYQSFFTDLKPLLQQSLASAATDGLIEFIHSHLDEIRDPHEGIPLDSSWEDLLETHDTQECGDFALAKYYQPGQSIGLGYHWFPIMNLLDEHLLDGTAMVLGSTLEARGVVFDPGLQGSYFRSMEDVAKHQANLLACTKAYPSITAAVQPLETMLAAAVSTGSGLYVTF